MSKTLMVLWVAFAAAVLQASVDESLRQAYLKGADAKVIYRVVDDDGTPVVGATAHVWFRTTYPKKVIKDWILTTDTNGMFVAEYRTNDRLSVGIEKTGYYHTFDRVTFSDPFAYPSAKGGKWHPYGGERTVMLKKIKDPGKLLVFPNSLRWCHIPEFNVWLGFDLERGEWVTPHGNGNKADVLLRFSSTRNGVHDYRYVMDVSFTNNPYAGACQLKKDDLSDFKTVYNADSNAHYKATFSYVSEQTPGNKRRWDFLDDDSYLVFRTRTRVDEHGNLIGAHYGKILGQWLSGPEFMVLSDGCFNPVENDVNLEDGACLRDVLRNLNKK